MKMIPMQMRQVNIIRLYTIQKLAFDLRKVPPTPPITRPDQPRIEQDRTPLILHQKTRMAENSELHFIRNRLSRWPPPRNGR